MKKINIDLHNEHCTKENTCRHFAVLFMVKNYVFTDDKNPNFYNEVYNEYCNRPNFPGHFISFSENLPRHPSAVIDFEKYGDFDTYFSNLSTSVVRDYRISEKKRYIFEEFRYENYVPDICEINHSNLNRKSRMNPYYLRSVEEMGGGPEVELPLVAPSCDIHNTRWFGVFRYLKNYRQHKIKTNKKLIAYAGVARDGDLSAITFIFGHNDYLKDGVMFYLLVNIIEKLCIMEKKPKCLQYWSLSGLETSGIVSWKKRMLFEAASLHAKPIVLGV
jgi:hypothetical protein